MMKLQVTAFSVPVHDPRRSETFYAALGILPQVSEKTNQPTDCLLVLRQANGDKGREMINFSSTCTLEQYLTYRQQLLEANIEPRESADANRHSLHLTDPDGNSIVVTVLVQTEEEVAT